MTPTGTLTSVLAEVSDWGPFFVVDTHSVDATPAPPWRPMRELVLAERVEAVRTYLAAGQPPDRIPVRVAASVTQLGLIARLISPALGCLVHSGLSPAMDLDNLWWQPALGSLFPLSIGDARMATAAELISGPVSELVHATREFSVSERVLWGNVASAINGAASMIGTARPALAARATAAATELLTLPPLRHTYTRHPGGRFQRRSCCLIYQASPAKSRAAVCGDCVLAVRR